MEIKTYNMCVRGSIEYNNIYFIFTRICLDHYSENALTWVWRGGEKHAEKNWYNRLYFRLHTLKLMEKLY
jgi:hypothetical protein